MHAQQAVVIWVDRYHAIGIVEVQLCQLSANPQLLNDMCCIQNGCTSHVAAVHINGIIDTTIYGVVFVGAKIRSFCSQNP